MDPSQIPEPKFFLQDELIYFLQKNATLSVEMVKRSGQKIILKTELQICGKEICNQASEIDFSELAVVYKENLKLVNDNLVGQLNEQRKFMHELTLHVQRQEKAIESLSKALAQYDRPINTEHIPGDPFSGV